MRHRVDGRKFGRNTSHRIAMLRNMANAVIEKEQIITTVQKAKEARRVVDRLVTLGKKGTPHAMRLAFDRTRNERVVRKLFKELAERYGKRAGGYTRVLKLDARRWGDAAEQAVLELVDHPELDRKRKVKAQPAGTAEQAAAALPTGDPTKRFKKQFQGKSKVAGGASKKAAKTQAGGGGSKRGGGGSGGSSGS